MVFASRGGKTKELLPIVDICKAKGVHIITVTENMESPLAQAADVVLKQHVNKETDKWNAQGTTSTTALCMIFHALQAGELAFGCQQHDHSGTGADDNSVDEHLAGFCTKIKVVLNKDGSATVSDNGRGIPTELLEEIFTSLNMGSNINTSNKASLKAETLGQNGTGTLAICGLAERVEITSHRGGTENIWKTLVFEEGEKVAEDTGKCSPDKHGMTIKYKPSKVMGKQTKIVWDQVHNELLNLQYLNKNKIHIDSVYLGKDGIVEEKYKTGASMKNTYDRNILN